MSRPHKPHEIDLPLRSLARQDVTWNQQNAIQPRQRQLQKRAPGGRTDDFNGDRPVTHPKVRTRGQELQRGDNSPIGNPKSFSRRFRRKEAAHYMGLSISWMDKARSTGTGPKFIAIGGSIMYDQRDLDAFLDRHRYNSTSEYNDT
jgi:predicted DNA-binding transcriptional regulator AlpA